MPARHRFPDRSPAFTLALFAATLSAVAAGCTHRRPEHTGSERSRIAVTDLSPRFLAFYDSATARPMEADARWILWKRLYGFAAVPPTPLGDSMARRILDAAWDRYPPALPTIRRGAAGLGVAPDSVLRRVVGLLGCGERTQVGLTFFVGGFDGGAFAYGSADGTPRVAIPLEAGDALGSLVHELTHAVHRSAGCANMKSGYGQSLAELVVTEGVAMRAAEQLLPGRPAIRYIHGAQGWLDSAAARRTAILNGVREHLADSGATTAQRFTFGGGATGLTREAYYAGWRIVGALLDDGMSLREIAHAPAERMPALVRRGIDLELRARGP